jgi:hydrogenase expression/formation protein HypE
MPSRAIFPVGKLPPSYVQSLLDACPIPRSSGVIVGPRFGEDAAVVDLGEKYLVVKTDPITFTTEHLGWYAVNINANDIAALGARPRWFLATLLLPEKKTNSNLVRRIFQDTLRACRTLGVTLCGGHTEVTAGLNRPIVVGQMLGEVEKLNLVRKESQRPGDAVLLTKGIAIEGTAILAREKRQALRAKLSGPTVRRARQLLFNPGISVVRDAQIAIHAGDVHAMHDPTEGGLLSGLYEIARAGGVGLRIWKERVPVFSETRVFSQVLRFDPFALIASGALLVVCSRESAPRILQAYRRRRITVAIIGQVCRESEGIRIVAGGRDRPLRLPAQDEIASFVG